MLRTEDHNNKESKNCLFSLKKPTPVSAKHYFLSFVKKILLFLPLCDGERQESKILYLTVKNWNKGIVSY